ncbi:MAG: HEAT repeat domain-containing protein [Phycisphaerales bacterium JB047]
MHTDAKRNRKLPRVRAMLPVGALLTAACVLSGCNTFDDVPRGTTSLLQVLNPQVSPSAAADMATDPYSAEKRYKGVTLLSSADFGGQPIYLELYIDGLDDDDASVRGASVRALGRHGDPEHAPLLINALKDSDDFVRLEAARGLQRIHSVEAIDPLLELIDENNEPNTDIRAAACDALGQYRQNRVVLGLISALGDSRLAVNNRVQHALMILTGQNFGLDGRAWIDWYNATDEIFAAAQPYTYPVFNRKKKIIEYLPLMPPPPNETPGTPVGMDPVIDG